MKLILILTLAALLAFTHALSDDIQAEFEAFIHKYNKSYSPDEYEQRLLIFAQNLQKFATHNANPENTHSLGINAFADRRPHEMRGNMRKASNAQRRANPIIDTVQHFENNQDYESNEEDSITVDWRTKGVVPEVVDGGDLPNGYNYMLGYAVDSAHAIKKNNLTLFSIQELFDCTQDLQSAIQFSISKGLETVQDYKGETNTGGCSYDPTKPQLHVRQWDYFVNYQDNSDIPEAMALQLQKQPILSIMSAESGDFLYYTGGVINNGCVSQAIVNHAMLLVGYSEQDDYWVFQNTWGREWGEEGYVRIKRGLDLCGVESNPLYPVL